MGLNDDWSYIATALALAKTGHIHYNGWSTAMLGWQLYLGALFIKLFGFSFTIVRASILLVGAGCVVLLHRIFLRFGLSPANAVLATLTVALSPLFLGLSFTFMSDIPGLFAILLCLYMCLRAEQADTDDHTALWLVAAALINAIAGSVRQISWLGLLVMVPATAWHLRARRRVLLSAAISCVLGAAIVFASLHWFKLQPYALSEKLLPLDDGSGGTKSPLKRLRGVVNALATVLLFSLPVLVAFLAKIRELPSRRRKQAAVLFSFCVLITVVEILRRKAALSTPFTGNIVGPRGVPDVSVLPGTPAEVFAYPVRFLLNFIILASSGAAIIWWRNTRSAVPASLPERVSSRAFFYLLAPFTAAYILLTITRFNIFDRYLLALVAVMVLCVVRFYQRLFGDLPIITHIAIATAALIGVVAMHDGFVYNRARLTAIDEVRQSGIPRDQIRGGMEYDAWTQIEDTGYVNDTRLASPTGAYQPTPAPTVPPECQFFFSEHTPSVVGRFGLSYSPLPCYRLAPFAAVTYSTWLPPQQRQIFIEQLR